MLHHGKEFDMREPNVEDVLDQLRSEFAVGERPVAFLGNTPPGTEMHFIYSYWRS